MLITLWQWYYRGKIVKKIFGKNVFVAGHLVFANKVKENLQIEYPDLTLKEIRYGRIICVVKNTSVTLCNNTKIENKIKRVKIKE